MDLLYKMKGKVNFAELLEHISEGDKVMLTATGRSMTPTFVDKKDKIVLSPVKDEEIVPGAVVLFNRGDVICVHRVIKREGNDLVIRGDGNSIKSLEKAKVANVYAILSGGTMFNGRPFTTTDKMWQWNTRLVMNFFPLYDICHKARRILCTYPLSLLVILPLLYLSFFNPAELTLPEQLPSDKLVHSLMYFGVSMVFWLEWLRSHKRRTRPSVRKGFLWCFAFPIVLGGIIELGQEYLTEVRSGDWLDFAANTAGVCVATVISLLAARIIRKKSRKS